MDCFRGFSFLPSCRVNAGVSLDRKRQYRWQVPPIVERDFGYGVLLRPRLPLRAFANLA